MSSSRTSFATIGNIINASLLLLSLSYAGIVIHFTQPGVEGFLDAQWREDGFCVKNKDVPYLSSFDTCLYVDLLLSGVLAIMYYQWRHLPEMERASKIVPMVILSTCGHGIAHGVMASKFRDGRYEAEKSQGVQEIPPWPQLVAFVALFWFPLLKASMPRINSFVVAVFACLVTYAPILAGGLKKELGFGYVQTVVSVAFHVSELSLPSSEKNFREYVTLPMAGIIPVCVSYVEALFCSGSYFNFKAAGGHFWYDFSIIASSIAFYLDARLNCKEKQI